ncbi:MAG: peptidoglycan DD-metalloendopeptidase family protein [Gammaproteobacteria bacterium]|nr:peptidoglycan DD-metalloendopeptidase family protein [Gammaproteobacteria bacterium]MYE51485.1 peptidoglycan DD-metalloendopeptidase family protein [Gammaproteobacteria bacterium]MYF50518.1 peptidoglycan DD-metalloendopeptidase family protein [Gammaproteobacteria bacterium]
MNSSRYSTAYPLGIALVCVCLCAFGIVRYEGRPDEEAGSAAAPISLPPPILAIAPLPQASAPPADANQTVVVQPGDSLALIFSREGLSAQSLHRLVNADPLGAQLAKIAPGEEFSFLRDEDDRLQSLSYSPDPFRTLKFSREGSRFRGEEIILEPQRKTVYKHGIIDHSLFTASQRAGLPDLVAMELAQIFQWDIDFVLDIRDGDSFYVLLEEEYLEGEFIGFGNILAAEFINQGDSYRAARYVGPNDEANYFDPEGRSMRKAFLRAPVSFTRISSNFNLRRKHPLWNSSMPHRGIDYAAPRGTPILASGDGVVTKASKTRANGNYVVLRHGEQFVTKYLHMSRFARGIRAGKRVQQGDTIGYVGATGWATGPHLHYEFLVNGVHQNPRTVKLPDAEPVPAAEAERFQESTAPLLASLSAHRNKSLLAVGR